MPNAETDLPTLSQAFESAKAELDLEPKKETAEETVEPDTEPEGSTEEQPERTEEAADQVEETADQTIETETEEDKLLSPEEEKLTGSAREKALARAFTKKTMALARERKEFARAKVLWDAMQEDPEGTARLIAQQAGLKIEDAKTQPAAADSATQPDLVTRLSEKLRNSLGPDLNFLADKFAPVLADELSEMRREVQTTKQSLAEREKADNMRAAGDLVNNFRKSHKDFDTVYPKMLTLMKSLELKGDMTPEDYMESMYTLATMRKQKAIAKKEVLDQIRKSADNAEPRERGAPASDITAGKPGKLLSLRESFEEAKKELGLR